MASADFDAYELQTASPPKPHQGHKKSWRELNSTVRETWKAITAITPSTQSNFMFRRVTDDLGETTTVLYFLGTQEKGKDSTLLKVDVPDEPLYHPSPEFGEEAKLSPLWISPVFELHSNVGSVPMSKEEQLMRERKRLGTYGITAYELHTEDGLFVVPLNNTLYTFKDVLGCTNVAREISTTTPGARLDPKLCPSNTDLLAFIHDFDIWLVCLHTGREIRLTHVHKGDVKVEHDPYSAGVPSFVIQEEFDRYTGYWWSPKCHRLANGRRTYHILYEEVDESDVELVSISSASGHDSTPEFYRYPKAGANNAYSTLKLLEITISYTGPVNQVTDIAFKNFSMKEALFEICPWGEYLSRAGWTPDGKYMYAVIIDRLQLHQAVYLIALSSFYTAADNKQCRPHIQCIFEERSPVWINVHDILHFFPQASENEISFLYASEKSGFRHLYVIRSQLHPAGQWVKGQHMGQGDVADSDLSCQILSEVAITSGPWVVLPKEVWVDEGRHLVFFMGLKDTPLESHLYVTRYDELSEPVRLTEIGYSHSLQLNEDFTKFVSVFSSLESPPQSTVFKLDYTSQGHIRCYPLGFLTARTEAIPYSPPTLFQYPSRSGHTAYGLYFLPRAYEQGRRYPTVLFVYGGPHVQMVTNSFKGQKFLRLHTLAADGYVVVVIDGRGSNNRGLQFEAVLKNKLGTVEINDQVEGILWLASQTDFIDMSRVAIHGWSYGGYLALMGITQRSDIFKVAVAGAPVVSWDLYDTGYTERYIGLPQNNPDVYKRGNVLTYMDQLPDLDTKLLLIHGLIDENVHFSHTSALINYLVTHCKPHQLQVYPRERHGIRSHEASEHYKTTVLKFLQDYL